MADCHLLNIFSNLGGIFLNNIQQKWPLCVHNLCNHLQHGAKSIIVYQNVYVYL